MTNREREILHILKSQPLISQNELAETLGITRSSVAVHITNLMKKGYIAGKGYIVREDPYACVIGACNIDIQGVPAHNVSLRNSNIGQVKMSLGGVGRNIAENLTRLGVQTKLISAVGDDFYGKKILEEASKIGLDMNDTCVVNGAATSTYLSILDENRDMYMAISHMDIYEHMTLSFIKSKSHIIEHSGICVLDANLPTEIISYILEAYKEKDFFLDTVSIEKALKLKPYLGHFHTIKPNKVEAEAITGIQIQHEGDVQKVMAYFHNKGVKQVFLTMGSEGVYISDRDVLTFLEAPKVHVVNASGAGDAFLSGLVYAYLHQNTMIQAARIATALAAMTLGHELTNHPNLTEEHLLNLLKE